MKVAFCGPSGGGKTTLAEFISEKFNIPYIRGSASHIMNDEDKQFLTGLGYNFTGHKEVIEKSGNIELIYNFENIVRQRRKELIINNPAFITDRSPVDNIVYFLLQASYGMGDFATASFIEECKGVMPELTHVIYIRSVNPNGIEDNKSRIVNREYQRMVDSVFSMVLNYYMECINVRLLMIDYWDLDKRKEEVTKFLNTPITETDGVAL